MDEAQKLKQQNPERTRVITDEEKSSAMERAKKVQRNRPSEIPSFIKPIQPSHVTNCAWLVRILRTSGSDKVAGVFRSKKKKVARVSLVFKILEASIKQEDFEDIAGEDFKRWRKGEGNCLNNCLPNSPQENNTTSPSVSKTEVDLEEYESRNDSDEHDPKPAIDFKDLRSIKDFIILVNGMAINSEFSKHIQTKYYELCRSQKTYLHDHLRHGLNHKLVVGIISHTVNIADTIRASNLTTLRDNFSTWSKTLNSFQELGMNVGFLRARLDQLMSYGFVEKRKTEARLERQSTEEKIRELEGSLLHVREVKTRLDAEIEALNLPVENHEVMFQKLAQAPW